MANVANINDDVLRKELEEANAHLRGRRPTEAVHALVDTFVAMVTRNPEILSVTRPGRRGPMSVVASWPQLGATFAPGTLASGAPEPLFTKERFAMSEAITYYEFVVDTAIAQGL